MKRALAWLVWGQSYLDEARVSAIQARLYLPYPRILITNVETAACLPPNAPFEHVEIVELGTPTLRMKAELYRLLPLEYDSFLFLDTDTAVLNDVSFGFDMAERHGMAASMAPHYNLDSFWGFDRVLHTLNVPCVGQLQYNTGVLFFIRRPEIEQVMQLWSKLASEVNVDAGHRFSDQPFFTLALELLHFNPYTLSPAYNYRDLGELASGLVRIWHSHSPPPQDLNEFIHSWPPRRFRLGKRVAY